MTGRRQPSIPPKIPGYEFVRLLGMGGFADVFEYRQEFPRRSVAVKVLLSGSLDQDARDAFFDEANVMAQLSHHPSIVTVYHADIAADGRPFLVMEYCSRPGLGTRYRMERFTVAEVLRIGIRVASAAEAAHQLGILHRDIKPANILATDFGWPALTDFGIASTLGSTTEATGMSIPWSAPELLAENPSGDVRGDVYSLAATLFSLLVGRSPFEIPGKSNTPADLVSRIERAPLPPIGREDVPSGLSAVLSRAMAKDPERRFVSAVAFAHALQQVERSLHLPVTSIDLSQDLLPEVPATMRQDASAGAGPAGPGNPEDGQATRLRPLVSIDPEQEPAQASEAQQPSRRAAVVAPQAPPPMPPVPLPDSGDETRLRPVTTIEAQEALEPVLGYQASVGRPAASYVQTDYPQPGYAQPDYLQPGAQPTQAGGYPGGQPSAPGGPEFARQTGTTSFAPSREEMRSQHYRAKADEAPQDDRPRRSRKGVSIVAGVLVVAALGAVAYLTLDRESEPDPTATDTPIPTPTVVIESSIASPAKVTGLDQGDGQVLFTWENPDPKDGDTYLWREVDARSDGPAVRTDKTSALVSLPPDQSVVCISVSIVRASGAMSTTPAQECSQ